MKYLTLKEAMTQIREVIEPTKSVDRKVIKARLQGAQQMTPEGK